MGLCRVDTDRLRGLASRLGAQAVALRSAVPAAGLLAEHGYWSASSDIAFRLIGADEWLESWVASLRERADLVDIDHTFFTTSSFATTEQLRRATSGAALATHLTSPRAVASSLGDDLDGSAMALLRLVHGEAHDGTIAAFFARLPQSTVIRLATEHADIVGDLGGAPLPLRFLANEVRLTRALAGAQRDDEVEVLRRLAERHARLALFDWPAGRLAEWIGPIGADHVAMLVPGTGADVWSYERLREQGQRMVDHDPSSGNLAVVATLAHISPPTVAHAALGGYADRGGQDLEQFVAGLDLAGRHVTLIGHSYGSTVVGAALHAGISASLPTTTDVIFLGSPGVRFDRATDLPVPAERIWVGLIPGDEITLAVHPRTLPELARCNGGLAPPIQACDLDEWLLHGRNPAHPEFGAQVFVSDPAPGTVIEHTAYLSLDGGVPSGVLAHILEIATGRYGDVVLVRRHPSR